MIAENVVRQHAERTGVLSVAPLWVPGCKCGWEGQYQLTRDAARALYRAHRRWALRSLQHQLLHRRAVA